MVKKILFRLVAVWIGLVIPLVVSEIILRFLPVTEGFRALPVNEKNAVFRFTPNRTSTWSAGWNFALVNTVRVNNYGFVNDQDYEPKENSPLLAVIGDSFVEAAMIPYRLTAHGRLAESVRDRGRVYSFAASGAGFSQYLVWAEYARDTFRPSGMVFVIIANDFAESIFKYKHSPGFHVFVETDSGKLALQRVDYKPGLVRKVFRRSALAMYLILNLKVHANLRLPLPFIKLDEGENISNVPAVVEEEILTNVMRGMIKFFDELPTRTGLESTRILFVVDGIRQSIYDPKVRELARGSYWDRVRRHFFKEASARGYEVVDMHPIFQRDFRIKGQRFEFPTDKHWNQVGHRLAGTAVEGTAVYRRVFGRENKNVR